jgi:signal transduction histidine kinase
MEIIVFLSIVIAVGAVLTSIVLVRRVKKQIAEMTDVLVDVKNGNGNRRILSATNELTAPLAYEINEIVVAYESRLSTVRQTEETNRQLMTSLSHDVRTPLTTLLGYLDATHKGLVTGKDRNDYIETARRKAHDLKEYIDVLFDWFKLNSNEFALEIQSVEAAELTRNILIDWIPIFEDKQVEYDIDIPEQPVRVRLDMDSYMRIVNNLIQNVIAHSHADKIKIALSKKENNMELLLADNGVGIEKEDLKHIFERLYKCDKGRSEKGSGLGLSIVHQLVEKMGGSITVETVVLLSRKTPDDTIEVDLDLDELDITAAESKATYQEIKDYVLKEFGLKVSTLYISQIKRKCGIDVGEHYNISQKENQKVPQCPKEKEDAIRAALEHFAMI